MEGTSHNQEESSTASASVTSYVQVPSGMWAWVCTTLEAIEQANADVQRRLENVERELANSVKRIDCIDLPGSVKEGPGYKVHHDITDEAETRRLIEAEIRSWNYAKDLASGKVPVPPLPGAQ